jgi:tRNA-binding protein
MTKTIITKKDFDKLDMCLGIIKTVEDLEGTIKPFYKVSVDFGPEIGIRWSGIQAKEVYTKEELTNKQVVGLINIEPMYIAGFKSEVYLLGVPDENKAVSFLAGDRPAKIGGAVF